MYTSFVLETQDELKALEEQLKKFKAQNYSGGKTWTAIGTNLTTVLDYGEKYLKIQRERSFAGQEEYSSMFPAPDVVGKRISEYAEDLQTAAQKYYDAHKDPTSWLAKSKKAEKARAEIAKLTAFDAKALVNAGKKVKGGKWEPPKLDGQQAWVDARVGFARLAGQKAVDFKRYLGVAQGYLRTGPSALPQAKQLVAQVAKEQLAFNKDPIFIASRENPPAWPKGADPEVRKRMEKEGLDGFEDGMRASAQMLLYSEQINEVVADLTELAEDEAQTELTAEGCMQQLIKWRDDLKALATKTSKMDWPSDKEILLKNDTAWDEHPAETARKGIRVKYTAKRNEIRERMSSANVVATKMSKLRVRVAKLAEPSLEVTKSKKNLLDLFDKQSDKPTLYYAEVDDFTELATRLDKKIIG
jgi:hypothetical protein